MKSRSSRAEEGCNPCPPANAVDPPSPPPPRVELPPTEAPPGIRGFGATDGENTEADEMDATDAADENLRDPIPPR